MTAFPFAPLEAGAYGVIMADPPWRFSSYTPKGQLGGAGGHYDLMTIEELRDLPVKDLAGDDCWLWLWALNPMLPHAFSVLEAWRFNFVTAGTWVKMGGSGKLAFGQGFVLRASEEPYILARRGKPPTCSRSIRQTILAPRREHSRKPDEAYAAAETLFGPARRADLFARESRPGWEAWGREASKFDAEEV
jgi:N6-adenosine-specific RNA methylase IME4